MKRLVSLVIALLAICGLLAYTSHQLERTSGSTGA